MSGTFGERIFRLMDAHFVGRAFELNLFREWLTRLDERPERVLNVYGTAGMGKTYLLERYAALAGESGALPVAVDAGDAMGRRERLLEAMMGQLGETIDESRSGGLMRRCLDALNGRAAERRIVLLIDGYEEIGGLDHWLRTAFLPGLSGDALIVIAGRFPLEGPWRHTPAWRKMIVRLPLAELSYDELRAYMRNWDVEDELAVDAVWLRTRGHPLAVSLLTPAAGETPLTSAPLEPDDREPLEALLDDWLREAPDDELRRVLYAASAVRTFRQELLALLLEAEVSPTLFDRLTGLSFVARTARGWQLHELVWETVRRHFRERMPEAYERFRDRAVVYYRTKLEEGLARGADVTRELGELLRYADNPVLRAHFRHSRASRNYREPLAAANLEEAQAYVRRRLKEERSWKVLCADPESGARFRFELPAGLGRARLALKPLQELMALDDEAVRLLRSPEGRIVGLFAVVPVNGATCEWLAAAPVSRAFFADLPPEERKRLRALPAGSKETMYVYVMDLESFAADDLRSDLMQAMLELVLAGTQLVESPPPHDYYRLGKASLGFEPLPGARHRDYGGAEPAPTYALDTRRDRLLGLVNRLVRAPDRRRPDQAAARPSEADWAELTPREREVAGRLVLGLTNAEIAAALYVSEAAVKKHVNAMLSKYGLRNRTQLANRLLNN